MPSVVRASASVHRSTTTTTPAVVRSTAAFLVETIISVECRAYSVELWSTGARPPRLNLLFQLTVELHKV